MRLVLAVGNTVGNRLCLLPSTHSADLTQGPKVAASSSQSNNSAYSCLDGEKF